MKSEEKSKESEDKQTKTNRQTETNKRHTDTQTGVNKSLVKKFLVINVITMWVCIDQRQDRNLKNIPQLSYH